MDEVITRWFERIARHSARRPRLVLALAGIVAALALGLAAARLELRTSNLDLVDPDLAPVRAFREFAEEFGTPNVLVVVLEGEEEAALEQAVRRLGPALRRVAGVRSVLDRLDYEAEILADLGLDEFLTSYDRRLFFVLVQPADPHSSAATIEPLVTGVREAIAASNVEQLGVKAGLTGLPQYALDDRDNVRSDLSRLTPLSAVLVLGVFVVGFGRLRRPLLATTALGFGVAWTLGVATLWPGHLTLLSAFSCSILFGLGIDCGIHVVARVEELVAQGESEGESALRSLRELAPGLTTAALTTAVAFFAMIGSGLRGFAELGAIAGAGVMLCLAATVWVLPALLVVAAPRRAARSRSLDWGAVLARLPRPRLAVALVSAALLSPLVARPVFDDDYLALQPRGSEAVRLEREMVERSDLAPQFAAFVVESRDEARQLSDRLLDEDTVGEVHSIVDLEELTDADGSPLPVPEAWRSGLESPRGRLAVYAYPSEDAWGAAGRDRFLERMRAIDPDVTGMPVLGEFLVARSRSAMRRTLWLGGLAVLACVALDLRRPRWVMLAMTPTVLTMLALPLLLRALGLALDPISVMALPVVLGVAVDDGVHLVHRYLAERGDVARAVAGSGRAVVLTSVTTLAAFATLVLAHHRGLASFGSVLSVGVSAALLFSVLVLPVALSWFGQPRSAGRVIQASPSSSDPLTARFPEP